MWRATLGGPGLARLLPRIKLTGAQGSAVSFDAALISEPCEGLKPRLRPHHLSTDVHFALETGREWWAAGRARDYAIKQ